MKAEHPSQLLYPGKGLWSSFFPLWRVLIPRTFKSHYFDKNGKEVIDKVRRLFDHSLVSRPFLWCNETRSIGHLDKGRGWRIPTTSQETKSDNYTELFYSIQKQQHKHMALSKLMGGKQKYHLHVSHEFCFPMLSTVLQGRTNCFYQGEVSERPDWQVVVNLCKGLS